uniref:Uncharacterized protein n=1 Tax=Oryza rufipogon TaxID=4529 RepID=A0A679BBY2_ORYRU|nr:hypothetical protein [Oryza rufipogon]BBF90141.1 hypothetical protein [Oryza rufipogon]
MVAPPAIAIVAPPTAATIVPAVVSNGSACSSPAVVHPAFVNAADVALAAATVIVVVRPAVVAVVVGNGSARSSLAVADPALVDAIDAPTTVVARKLLLPSLMPPLSETTVALVDTADAAWAVT